MYEICFIDDTIPVTSEKSINESHRLNRSNLQLLLDNEDAWAEIEVRSLVISLLSDPSLWSVSAFIHPSIYLNSVENEAYRPDIIVFDWEYPGGTDDSVTTLSEILRTTYAVVYIYSGGDHKTQIEQALQQPVLKCFKDKRLFLLMKDEPNSQVKLLDEARKFYDSNFSFRFGSVLRTAALKALDKVLVDLGSDDIDFVTSLIADGETEESDIKGFILEKVKHNLLEDSSLPDTLKKFDESSINELVHFLVSKITDTINSIDLGCNFNSIPIKQNADNDDVSKILWSKRIYFTPSDALVRKGDIVKEKDTNRYYLVITADCDLYRFWKKNFGFINLIPLYNCSSDSGNIKAKLGIIRNDTQLNKVVCNMAADSLTSPIPNMVQGPFICPFLFIGEKPSYFIGFPKEIVSKQIAAPDIPEGVQPSERQKIRLSYIHWASYERISTISEPFASALVQHCISILSGYGTPNYSSVVKNVLKEDVRSFLVGDNIQKE